MIKVPYEKIKRWLINEEGYKRLPYDDTTGHPIKLKTGKLTVGIGRNLEAKPLSEAVIDLMLQEDIQEATQGCLKIYGADVFERLNENQQLSLISMCFQMGIMGLGGFKKANAEVKLGNFEKAAEYFAQSKWAHQDSPARAKRTIKLLTDDNV